MSRPSTLSRARQREVSLGQGSRGCRSPGRDFQPAEGSRAAEWAAGCWRRATTSPASHPGARPPTGGRTDSTWSPLRAISQEINELEFHISPAWLSSRPQTSVGTAGTRSRTRCATNGSSVSCCGLSTASPMSGSLRRASGAPRNGRSGNVLPDGFRPHRGQQRRARRRCRHGQALARSRSGPPVRAPQAQSGRGRKVTAVAAAQRQPRRRVRSAVLNDHLRRAGASRGRPQVRTL